MRRSDGLDVSLAISYNLFVTLGQPANLETAPAPGVTSSGCCFFLETVMSEYEIVNTTTGEVVEDRQQRASHLHTQACNKREAAWEFYAALAEIQREELWRELGHDSFEQYCDSEHGITYRYAKMMIDATEVRSNLNHGSGATLPASERVARPLTKLPAEEQAEAWEEVVSEAEETGEKITAKKVEQVVANRVDNHRAKGTGENEWYTPAKYVELAREVMGGFDLDPASSQIAQKGVNAGKFYTIDDDGLEQPWFGKVWLNPPYAQPAIAQFCEKMVNEYMVGNVSEAIMLTHNYTDTAWFHCAEAASAAICFTRGRIAFESPDGKKAAPTQGQAFFYFGSNPDKFREVFGEVGFIR